MTHRYPSPYDQWPVVWHSGIWRAVFLTSMLCCVAWLQKVANSKYRNLLAGGLLVVLAGDNFAGAPQKNPTLPWSVMVPGLWKIRNNKEAPRFGEGRVMISPEAEQQLLISRVNDLQSDFLGKRLALWSHLNLLEQIPKVNGSSTLQIREQKQLESLLYGPTPLTLEGLTRFLNVAYATAPGQVIEWERRPNCMPLITCGQTPIFASPQDTLGALTNAGFEPARTVYLPLEAERFIGAGGETSSKVLSTQFATHRIECTVEAAQPTMVVIAQSFYHPWHAYVDDTPTRLWQANYAFQALQIPRGQHRVRVVYEDFDFRLGAILSALTVLCCAGLWFWRPKC
jgi:hypothetical protein